MHTDDPEQLSAKMALDRAISEGIDVGTFSEVGWAPPESGLMLERDWLVAIEAVNRSHSSYMWQLGDLWAFGDRTYGNRKALTESPEWRGPAFQTCMDAASVAKKFETSRRREVLPFSHHREAASLPPDTADEMLDWAVNEGKSRKDLRDRVQRWKTDSSKYESEQATVLVETFIATASMGRVRELNLRRTLKIAPDLAMRVAKGELKVNSAYVVAKERHKAAVDAAQASREQSSAEWLAAAKNRPTSLVIATVRTTLEEEREHVKRTIDVLISLATSLRKLTDANVSCDALMRGMTREQATEVERYFRTGVPFLKNLLVTCSVLKKEEVYGHARTPTGC